MYSQIIPDNTKPLPDYPTRELSGITKDMASSSQDKKTINCLSDTDVDTDTDDSDIVIVDEKREKIFTSLKERLGKSTYKDTDSLKKEDKDYDYLSKDLPDTKANLSKNGKTKTNKMNRTSEIQDFSFTHELCEKMEVDHEDDDGNDVVLLTVEREKPTVKPLENLPKKQPKDSHNVSEIIDLSFVDDENYDANDLAMNLKEYNKNAPSYEKLDTLNIDIKKQQVEGVKSRETSSKQKSDKNVCLRIESDDDSETCEARVTDVSASESETEDLPSFFPSMKLGSSSSQNEMEFSQEESHEDENIPKKKKKGNAEETRKRNEEKKVME